MRNLFNCAAFVLLMINQSWSQSTTDHFESLTILKYSEEDRVLSRETLTGEEAAKLDIPSYLADNHEVARIQIVGTRDVDNVMHKLRFDSRNSPYEVGDHLCQTEVVTMRPQAGLVICSNEDFTGLRVKELKGVIQANKYGGIEVNDVITHFNNSPVTTPCELSMVVRDCEVGQSVPVEIMENGRARVEHIKVGGQMVRTISYEVCEEPDFFTHAPANSNEIITGDLTVYPNPSRGMSFINFESNQDKPVSFYVQAADGSIVHSEQRDYFSGNLRSSYDFVGLTSGTYYFVIEQNGEVYRKKVMYMNN